MTAPPNRGVFISYRRQDAAFHAGWLYEQLVNKFGEPHVFKDVDSIQPGDDFINVIRSAVRSCHTLLVVIGPKWLNIPDKHGNRRIDDPSDFIRLELETALAAGLQIIPVLVLESVMPATDDLPISITQLARRNAVEITSSHFQADLARLIRAVDQERRAREAAAQSTGAARPPRSEPRPSPTGPPFDPRSGGLFAGRYELLGLLGRGGLSEVHRGRDTQHGRDVAVKVFRADLARDPQLRARFHGAVQSAAVLSHPAIVAIYDVGESPTESGPLPYLVAEFVDGRTLRDIVTGSGPMPVSQAVRVIVDVCAALSFGHHRQVIHRGVTPTNVMINRAGVVKVMDFGVIRALDGSTGTASAIGTAQYLAPEQIRREPVDARSDVYSAGCVLFELLTGQPPFTGDSPVAVADHHVNRAPRTPSELNPAIPPALDAVLRTALSKNPADRYPSAAALSSELVRAGSTPPPRPPSRPTTAPAPAPAPANPTRQLYRDVQPPARPPAGPTVRPDRRRSGSRTILGVVLAVLIVLGLAGAFGYRLLGVPTGEQPVTVPDVVGLSVEDATAELSQAGLSSTQRTDTAAVGPVGQVLRADPEPGTEVPAGSQVILVVGTPASDPAVVPPISSESPGPPLPSPTTRPPDPTVPIPDVAGQDAADAERILEGLGFSVVVQTVDAGASAGQAIGTDPPAGSQAKQGSEITINVSSGDSGKQQLPNVVGQQVSEAARILNAAGFAKITARAQQVSDPTQNGVVQQQDPGAGQDVSTSETVQLTVGQFAGGVDGG